LRGEALQITQHGPRDAKINPCNVHHWIIRCPRYTSRTHSRVAMARQCAFGHIDCTRGEV
jgi:hypothetical protein